MKPKFSVPFNGDLNLIETFKTWQSHIHMVYGRAEDGYPQGRNTTNRQKISMDDITDLINDLKKINIKFNYLINGNCHGNKEFNYEYRSKFVRFVKELKERGADTVTLGNPFLLEVIKQEVPDIDISASVLLEADNLTRIKQVARAGAKYILVSKTLLKNFEGLKKIAQGLPKDAVPILLANDPCLHNCAYTNYHNNTLSHFSSEGNDYVNYCRLHCNQDFANDPRKVMSASFIRPEDIAAYVETGFSFFKLCDRKQTTPWLENVIAAYANENYEGNLADLMAPWSNIGGKYPFPAKISSKDIDKRGFEGMRSNLRFSPQINNKAMNGYLEYWKNVKTAGCANEDCASCEYCLNIAKKAYLPESERNKIIAENLSIALESAKRSAT